MAGVLEGSTGLAAAWKLAPPRPRPEPQRKGSAASVGQGSKAAAAEAGARAAGDRLVLLSSEQSGTDAALWFREVDASGGVAGQVRCR